MSTTLTINSFKAGVSWDYRQTTAIGSDTSNVSAFNNSCSFSNGSGNGKAAQVYPVTLTVTGSGSSSIDLSSATKDPLGNALAFTKIKGIYFSHNTPAATGVTTITGNFFSDIVMGVASTSVYTLNPGHFALLGGSGTSSDLGWAVTATTHDTITFSNADAASVSIDVCVIGE